MPQSELNILITGAGSGVGQGLALALGAAGHHIFATDKNGDAARFQCHTKRAASPFSPSSVHAMDVTDAAAVESFFSQLGDESIDVLINNAGLQHVAPLEEFPQERWDLLIDVMLKGAARMSRAVLPGMRRSGFGRIVNIGSIHSLVASPYKSAYVAAKHGLVGLAKALALETSDVDITVNTICPSYIRTPLVDAQIDAQARSHGISPQEVVDQIMLRPMPKRRFITIDEVHAAVAFLISDHARNITGQCIVMDGGWTVQ